MDNLDLTALSSNEPGLDWFHVAAMEWYSEERESGSTCVSGVVSRNHALIWTIVK